MMILQLELWTGSVFIEPGTGSGGLSHRMARTSRTPPLCTHLTPNQRVQCGKEFAELKLGEMVTDRQRFDNVSMDDADFLDLIHS